MSIQAILEEAAQLYPDHSALQCGNEQYTYCELLDKVLGTTRYLVNRGVSTQDTAVFLFRNTIDCVICFLALAWLNARVVPVEPESATSHKLLSLFETIRFSHVLGAPPEIDLLKKLDVGKHWSLVDVSESQIDATYLPNTDSRISFDQHEVFLYHFTSGSLGEPKAALHSQANLVRGAVIYKRAYQLRPEDTIIVPIPLMHSFGMVGGLLASLLSGSRLLLFDRLIPQQVVETVAHERATVLIAVPLVYDLLSRCMIPMNLDVSCLRICLSSGAQLPSEVAQRFASKFNRRIHQVYGTTETGIIAAQWPKEDDWPEKSVGSLLPGVAIRIVDENDRQLPPGSVGILLVKTSTMFMGYYGHPQATASVLHGDWYVTRDVAKQDDAGHLYLCGRKDTFINVGGKKVNPIEVEQVLLAHPAIKDALVYGKDAGSLGEQSHADVVLSAELSMEDLLCFCRERLASYQVPSHIRFVKEIPRTRLGKVKRSAIHG